MEGKDKAGFYFMKIIVAKYGCPILIEKPEPTPPEEEEIGYVINTNEYDLVQEADGYGFIVLGRKVKN